MCVHDVYVLLVLLLLRLRVGVFVCCLSTPVLAFDFFKFNIGQLNA